MAIGDGNYAIFFPSFQFCTNIVSAQSVAADTPDLTGFRKPVRSLPLMIEKIPNIDVNGIFFSEHKPFLTDVCGPIS